MRCHSLDCHAHAGAGLLSGDASHYNSWADLRLLELVLTYRWIRKKHGEWSSLSAQLTQSAKHCESL
ncbi:unnamed protein product [Urochloa humidicola]